MYKEDMALTYNGILLSHEKGELLPFATTWIDLENIVLSEISQIEKDKNHMISLICVIQNKQPTNKQNKLIF